MSIPMHLLLVVAAFCVCVSEGAPDGRMTRAKQQRPTRGFKNLEMMTARGFGKRGRISTRSEREFDEHALPERTNRAVPQFNNSRVTTAIGYGKRVPEIEPKEEEYRIRRTDFKSDKVNVAVGYGKRKLPTKRVYGLDNIWETLAAPEREGQEGDEEKLESIPIDWFVNEIVNNPDFARSVVRKFVDINQDGMLSSDELLRNV